MAWRPQSAAALPEERSASGQAGQDAARVYALAPKSCALDGWADWRRVRRWSIWRHPGGPDYFLPGCEPCRTRPDGGSDAATDRRDGSAGLGSREPLVGGACARGAQPESRRVLAVLQRVPRARRQRGRPPCGAPHTEADRPHQLAKQSGGEFNAVVVYDAISGRTPAAHGTSAMPVWGETMPETPGDEDLRANKLRIAKIVNYLRSIQVR